MNYLHTSITYWNYCIDFTNIYLSVIMNKDLNLQKVHWLLGTTKKLEETAENSCGSQGSVKDSCTTDNNLTYTFLTHTLLFYSTFRITPCIRQTWCIGSTVCFRQFVWLWLEILSMFYVSREVNCNQCWVAVVTHAHYLVIIIIICNIVFKSTLILSIEGYAFLMCFICQNYFTNSCSISQCSSQSYWEILKDRFCWRWWTKWKII